MAGEIWVKKDGTRIAVDDMTQEHVANTCKLFKLECEDTAHSRREAVRKFAREAKEKSDLARAAWEDELNEIAYEQNF